jgi:DNA mismatch repair ATPase MutS
MQGRANYEQQQLEEKERKAREIERSLADGSAFPELSSKQPVIDNLPKMNFRDIVNRVDEKLEDKSEDKTDIWEVLDSTNQKKTNKIIGITRRRNASPDEIFAALNKNYERWKTDYIKEYGEDYYEKYYRFSDWDYEYFDKLDEKDQMELQEQEEKEREKYEADNADYEQYMDYLNDVSYE